MATTIQILENGSFDFDGKNISKMMVHALYLLWKEEPTNKVRLIKLVREHTGHYLRESKDLVDFLEFSWEHRYAPNWVADSATVSGARTYEITGRVV